MIMDRWPAYSDLQGRVVRTNAEKIASPVLASCSRVPSEENMAAGGAIVPYTTRMPFSAGKERLLQLPDLHKPAVSHYLAHLDIVSPEPLRLRDRRRGLHGVRFAASADARWLPVASRTPDSQAPDPAPRQTPRAPCPGPRPSWVHGARSALPSPHRHRRRRRRHDRPRPRRGVHRAERPSVRCLEYPISVRPAEPPGCRSPLRRAALPRPVPAVHLGSRHTADPAQQVRRGGALARARGVEADAERLAWARGLSSELAGVRASPRGEPQRTLGELPVKRVDCGARLLLRLVLERDLAGRAAGAVVLLSV